MTEALQAELIEALHDLIDNIQTGSFESTGQCIDRAKAILTKAQSLAPSEIHDHTLPVTSPSAKGEA